MFAPSPISTRGAAFMSTPGSTTQRQHVIALEEHYFVLRMQRGRMAASAAASDASITF
jgi:hypothetical protein